MELDRKLWLKADRETVVEDGDPEAAFLLGNEGTEITQDEADRLGLGGSKKAATPANKARKATANKAADAEPAEGTDSE